MIAQKNSDEAVIEVFRKLRPGDLVTVDSARSLVKQMFLIRKDTIWQMLEDTRSTKRLKLDVPADIIVLTKEDVLQTIEYVKKSCKRRRIYR